MTYTNVFGGGTIDPADLSYLSLALAVNTTLVWPTEQQIGGPDVAAAIIDVTPSGPGLTITMPDARQVANGTNTVFNNVGADTFTVLDSLTGNTLLTVASGEVWILYLRDNSTQDGLWRTYQFGVGVSSAVAAALVGAGIKAITTTLNQKIDVQIETVTPVAIIDADRAQAIIWAGGTGVGNLPDPAVVGTDWFVYASNAGTGTFTLTPAAGLIDGAATKVMEVGTSFVLVTDGTDYYSIGSTGASSSTFDFISISVAGTGNYTLSGVELDRISYRLTGILTGARDVITPNTVQQYWVDNTTTGAFDLTVRTLAGLGVVVPQGESRILYCDGTDITNGQDTQSMQTATGITRLTVDVNGVVSLRSDGNTDAEIRRFELVHQDGTLRGQIGHGSDDILRFTNLIAGGNFALQATNAAVAVRNIIQSDPDGVMTLHDPVGNVIRLQIDAAGIVSLLSNGNTDSEDRRMLFRHQDLTTRGFVGYLASADLRLRNQIDSGSVILTGNDAGGTPETLLDCDPDGSGNLYQAAESLVNIRTRAAASGGGEVRNTLTGAGLERIITISDVALPVGSSATFVPTFPDGGGTNPITYSIVGSVVFLSLNAGNFSASTDALLSITGIPVAIRPNAATAAQCVIVTDNGGTVFGVANISPAGTITFGVGPTTGGFTASGNKGLPGNWSMSYPLDGG